MYKCIRLRSNPPEDAGRTLLYHARDLQHPELREQQSDRPLEPLRQRVHIQWNRCDGLREGDSLVVEALGSDSTGI